MLQTPNTNSVATAPGTALTQDKHRSIFNSFQAVPLTPASAENQGAFTVSMSPAGLQTGDRIAVKDFHQDTSKRSIKVDICLPQNENLESKSIMLNLPAIKNLEDPAEVHQATQKFLSDCTSKLSVASQLSYMFRLVEKPQPI